MMHILVITTQSEHTTKLHRNPSTSHGGSVGSYLVMEIDTDIKPGTKYDKAFRTIGDQEFIQAPGKSHFLETLDAIIIVDSKYYLSL